jgi:hypothetical protein
MFFLCADDATAQGFAQAANLPAAQPAWRQRDRSARKGKLAARAAPAAGPTIVETVTRVCPAIIELRTAVAKVLES